MLRADFEMFAVDATVRPNWSYRIMNVYVGWSALLGEVRRLTAGAELDASEVWPVQGQRIRV
jgi:hypothetical protein